MTTREGFRAGWAHWGVLVRIALLYFAATVGSLGLLAAICVVAVQALGWLAGVLLGIPAALVAVPWLVTLYLVQAFASRIAVLENRRALDAIRNARLFLHGRLVHGLRLMVASLVGTLVISILGVVVLVPVVLLLVALATVLNVVPLIVLGCLLLVPVFTILTAMLGTFRSSVWTIGYVTQVASVIAAGMPGLAPASPLASLFAALEPGPWRRCRAARRGSDPAPRRTGAGR